MRFMPGQTRATGSQHSMTELPTVPMDGAPFAARCDRPLLVARFARPQATLSRAMARPGFVTADAVAWLEVAHADLTLETDPFAILHDGLAGAGLDAAVAMTTARDVRPARMARAASGAPGAINLLVAVSVPLRPATLIEAMSIADEARTAAVVALDRPVAGGPATGTGTDCAVVAAPDGPEGEAFAGLHTDVGCAVAAAVFSAVDEAGRDWIAERAPARAGRTAWSEGA